MSKCDRRVKASLAYDHLSDEVLISSADGELAPAETAAVRAHLEACWHCRVRMEKIERAIEDLIDYRTGLVAPHTGLQDGSRSIFSARLNQYALELGPQSAWRNLLDHLGRAARALVTPRFAWAGALLAISVAIFLARLALSPTASANAVLERARISEKTARASVQHPVIYQKLRIHSRQGTVTRTIYRDLFSGKKAESSDATEGALDDPQRRMQEVNLDWQDPLSIASFLSWHASPPEKTDEVTRANDGLLVVQTKVLSGPLSEIDLSLRDGDYHAVTETLRFQDENIEMSEIDFSVLAFESLAPGILDPQAPPREPFAFSERPGVSGPSMNDLAEAEIEARMTLHILHADLGEPIDISSDSRQVLVSGVVDTTERKRELLEALQTIPHLRTSLVSAAEAPQKADSSGLKDDNPVLVVESAPLLERELHAAFPDAKARTKFVNDVLETTMKAAGRAWSLRRLSDRYTGELSSGLDTQSERKVEFLIRDDAGLLQQELNSLQRLLEQLTPGMASAHPAAAELPGDGAEPADWHWRVDSAFSDSQRIQNDISVLFSGSDVHNADPQAIVRDLLLAIQRMDKRLPVLCQEVSGDFLASADRRADIQKFGDSR